MRALVQRVLRAEVRVDDHVTGSIGRGLLVLVGVTPGDTEAIAISLAEKTANLRIFDDEAGIMNRSALDLSPDGRDAPAVLVVSQFTLYADCRKGRRPSYTRAAAPHIAEPLVNAYSASLRTRGLMVETGVFGAEMAVELINDGPVTIWLDSAELRSPV